MKANFIEVKTWENIEPIIAMENYEFLECVIGAKAFKKNRRLYRDLLFEKIVKPKRFIVDNINRCIYTNKAKKNYSVTYSKYDIAVCVGEKKTGIDVENYSNLSRCKAKIFMSKVEFEYFSTLFGHRKEIEVITLMWCCKESIGKLFDIGLSSGFNMCRFNKKGLVDIKLKMLEERKVIYFYYKFFDEYCMVLSSFYDLIGK